MPNGMNAAGDIIHPRSAKSFGGKKAAPFKKGGGRSTKSPRTATGKQRKGKR